MSHSFWQASIASRCTMQWKRHVSSLRRCSVKRLYMCERSSKICIIALSTLFHVSNHSSFTSLCRFSPSIQVKCFCLPVSFIWNQLFHQIFTHRQRKTPHQQSERVRAGSAADHSVYGKACCINRGIKYEYAFASFLNLGFCLRCIC